MSYSNQFFAVATHTMRPVLVGIVGGAGSGKKHFTTLLTSQLKRFAVEAVPIDFNNQGKHSTVPPTADCVLYHGLTVFEDPSLRPKLDVKVFLDMDTDLRLANLARRCPSKEIVVARDFHVHHVIKQKKLADIWVDTVTQEKLDHVVELILDVRRRGDAVCEPKEVEVYLDKYEKAPDVPVPSDFV